MPKVAKGRRKRAYSPKTRTGCLTCKIRRVKCDEARPACLRCTSTRRVCDGYYDPDPSRSIIVPVIASPSFDIYASPQSNRSFAFFVQRTCPQLAGFFGSDFWERYVLQAAYHESAVRHAIVAIGSLHELHEHQTATIDSNKSFALEQYNLAIRDLLAPLSQGRKRGVGVCLVSCILFICFENMQGHHVSAKLHIESGAKLLCETIYDRRNGALQHQVLRSRSHMDLYAPLEVLARIFAGLDPQVRTMIGFDQVNIYENPFSEFMYNDVPLSFSSVGEAKKFYEYGHCLFSSSEATHSEHSLTEVAAHKGHFANLASKMSLAIQAFVQSKSSSFTPKEDIAMAVLQLHVVSNSLQFEQVPPNQRPDSDKFLPQFEQLIALGEKVISSAFSSNDHGGQTTSFCLDMGIIIPLYYVAWQCPDPTIRRKAITLLRSTSRQEGLLNSLLLAKAAERIMEIEESILGEMKTCADGPNWARSTAVQPVLELDDRGGRLQYTRPAQGATAQVKVVEEVFSY